MFFDNSKIDLNKQDGFSLNPNSTWDESALDRYNEQAITDCKFLLGISIPAGHEVINTEAAEVNQSWLQQVVEMATGDSVQSSQEFSPASEAALRAWKNQLKAEAAKFNLRTSSEFRKGAVTAANGRPSWHSQSVGNEHGMALDFAPTPAISGPALEHINSELAAFFDYIRATYAPESIRELIYKYKGQVIRGKFLDHVRNPVTARTHRDHLHVVLWPPIKRIK